MKFECRPSFMLDQNDLQNHRRARRAPGSLAFPSVRASASHDGRRLYAAHDDREKAPVADRPRPATSCRI